MTGLGWADAATDADLAKLQGWAPNEDDEHGKLNSERRQLYDAQCDLPMLHRPQQARPINPTMLARVQEAHQKLGMDFTSSDGYATGSVDLRTYTALIGAEDDVWEWLAQIIGSCVASGGMRAWGMSMGWQVMVLGEPEELVGSTQFGRESLLTFGPYNYGIGRRLGNMKRGDGSYCSVHVQGFMKFGVVMCSVPQLRQIVGGEASDYPEPQSSSLYRAFGSWKHLDTLSRYADYPLLESVEVKRADEGVRFLREFKPMMICSSWGFKKQSTHRDGFAIYKRSGSWAHNMTICGVRVASDGNEYVQVCNSWGAQAHADGEYFYIPIEVFDSWLRSASCQTIGDIRLPQSVPTAW